MVQLHTSVKLMFKDRPSAKIEPKSWKVGVVGIIIEILPSFTLEAHGYEQCTQFIYALLQGKEEPTCM